MGNIVLKMLPLYLGCQSKFLKESAAVSQIILVIH